MRSIRGTRRTPAGASTSSWVWVARTGGGSIPPAGGGSIPPAGGGSIPPVGGGWIPLALGSSISLAFWAPLAAGALGVADGLSAPISGSGSGAVYLETGAFAPVGAARGTTGSGARGTTGSGARGITGSGALLGSTGSGASSGAGHSSLDEACGGCRPCPPRPARLRSRSRRAASRSCAVRWRRSATGSRLRREPAFEQVCGGARILARPSPSLLRQTRGEPLVVEQDRNR